MLLFQGESPVFFQRISFILYTAKMRELYNFLLIYLIRGKCFIEQAYCQNVICELILNLTRADLSMLTILEIIIPAKCLKTILRSDNVSYLMLGRPNVGICTCERSHVILTVDWSVNALFKHWIRLFAYSQILFFSIVAQERFALCLQMMQIYVSI